MPTIGIRGISSDTTERTHRVSAEVDGAPVWFESADCSLAPSVEALGSAFLIPALERGARLELPAPVSGVWLTNLAGLVPILNEWWRYPEILPAVPAVASGGASPRAGTALCFSGGVDSFHSLLRGGHRVDLLVLVQGFDIGLDDEARLAAFEPSFRAIARACGARAVVVRTNLRQHPLFGCAPWERTHGGALAAVGHLLADHAGRLIISSSYTYEEQLPWGSHWRTDPLWSSDRLSIVHLGASLWRDEKLEAIAEEELVRRHLRVCWENRSPEGNCSRCDKCVLTMLMLHVSGRLEAFSVFDHPASIAERLDAVPRTGWFRHYARLLDRGLEPDVDRAVRRLLRRSRAPGPFARTARRLARLTPRGIWRRLLAAGSRGKVISR